MSALLLVGQRHLIINLSPPWDAHNRINGGMLTPRDLRAWPSAYSGAPIFLQGSARRGGLFKVGHGAGRTSVFQKQGPMMGGKESFTRLGATRGDKTFPRVWRDVGDLIAPHASA